MRVKEHTKAIVTLDKNSLLARHHMLQQHKIDQEGVEIIDRSTCMKWNQRLILEVWHSVREVNSINEQIAFPDIYKNLKNNIVYLFSCAIDIL